MSALTLRDVWVEYGGQIVLERINLDIAAGAFLSVVVQVFGRRRNGTIHALRQPAIEKRQGTKSR